MGGYREAYIAWVQHFAGLDLEQAFFAARFWADIEAWARANLPALLDTLADGLSLKVRVELGAQTKCKSLVCTALHVGDAHAGSHASG